MSRQALLPHPDPPDSQGGPSRWDEFIANAPKMSPVRPDEVTSPRGEAWLRDIDRGRLRPTPEEARTLRADLEATGIDVGRVRTGYLWMMTSVAVAIGSLCGLLAILGYILIAQPGPGTFGGIGVGAPLVVLIIAAIVSGLAAVGASVNLLAALRTTASEWALTALFVLLSFVLPPVGALPIHNAHSGATVLFRRCGMRVSLLGLRVEQPSDASG